MCTVALSEKVSALVRGTRLQTVGGLTQTELNFIGFNRHRAKSQMLGRSCAATQPLELPLSQPHFKILCRARTEAKQKLPSSPRFSTTTRSAFPQTIHHPSSIIHHSSTHTHRHRRRHRHHSQPFPSPTPSNTSRARQRSATTAASIAASTEPFNTSRHQSSRGTSLA